MNSKNNKNSRGLLLFLPSTSRARCPLAFQSDFESGFTLVEALVSTVILLIAMSSSIYIYQSMMISKTQAESLVEVHVARNNIVNLLKNTLAWRYTVEANASPKPAWVSASTMSSTTCLAKHTDCASLLTAPGPATNGQIRLYDISQVLRYDPTVATSGFQNDGTLCNTFDGTAGAGNLNCPLHLNLYWEPLCPDSGPCLDPLVKIHGVFTFNAPLIGNQRPPSTARLNFEMIQVARYCPSTWTTPGLSLATFGGLVTITNAGKNVTTSEVTAVYPSDQGFQASTLEPCQTTMIQFQNAMNVGSPLQANAANQSSVCLYDASSGTPTTAPCLYEWHHLNNGIDTWELLEAGTSVYLHPNNDLLATTVYSFVIDAGKVQFYMNNVHQFSFAGGMKVRYRARFRPGSTLYQPSGFNNVDVIAQ